MTTPSDSGPAVEAIGLVKEFEKGRRTLWQRLRREPDQRERFRAVDGIDLLVERGEIFGVLGPNGAGKTTTLIGTRPLLDPALEWLALGILSAVLIAVGRVVFRRTEHRMRVRGTLGQH